MHEYLKVNGASFSDANSPSAELVELVKAQKQLLVTDAAAVQLDELFFDIVCRVVEGSVSINLLKTLLLRAEVSSNDTDVGQALANALWTSGTQIDQATQPDSWTRLCELTKDVGSSGIVDLQTLLSTLEFGLLASAKFVKDEAAIQKRLIKINTGLVYKQQKYNLLREETEGFGKLVAYLSHEAVTMDKTGALIKHVQAIVGNFDLDPNRVLDVLLDVFEEQPLNLSFVRIVQQFRRPNVANILGFKFMAYHQVAPVPKSEPPVETKKLTVTSKKVGKLAPVEVAVVEPEQAGTATNVSSVAADTPGSLCLMAALLISRSVLQIDELLSYLEPSLHCLAQEAATAETRFQLLVRTFGVVSLGSKNANNADKAAILPEAVASASQRIVTLFGNAGAELPHPEVATRGALARIIKNGQSILPEASVAVLDSSMQVTSFGSSDPLPLKLFGAHQSSLMGALLPCLMANAGVDSGPEFAAAFSEWSTYRMMTSGVVGGAGDKNQLFGLLAASLCLRDWVTAQYLLNLLEGHGVDTVFLNTGVRAALIALLLWTVEPLYRQNKSASYSLIQRGEASQENDVSSEVPKARLTSLRKLLCSALMQRDLPMLDGGDDIAGAAKRCSDLSTFPTDVLSMLSYLGHRIVDSALLFSKIARLLKQFLESVQDELSQDYVQHFTNDTNDPDTNDCATPAQQLVLDNLKAVVDIIQICFLPALNLGGANSPFLTSQVWAVLSLLPFQLRFRLYDGWRGAGTGKEGLQSTAKHTELLHAEAVALQETRGVLKRLSKENTKLTARKLARFVNSNPVVVHSYILSQIESFDNLIPHVVEALKYSSELAADVMAYCLVSQLQKDSGKMKRGDTNYTQWFSALARFTATFYKRYPTTELKGLFHYLLDRLSRGECLDLLVLKELLCVTGGCETLLNLSQMQLEGLSGGRALRNEVLNSSAAKAGSSGTKSTRILREELIASQTAMPMLLFIAQIRSRILFDTESMGMTTQLKLISHLFDTSQDVLMQFTDFLVAGSKHLDNLVALMPSFSVLLGEIGLAVPVAFQLVRPFVRAALLSSTDVDGNLSVDKVPDNLKCWFPFGAEVMDAIMQSVPNNTWELVSPQLFVLFWSLGLYDISTPVERYNQEITRLRDRYSELDHKTLALLNPLNSLSNVELARLDRQRKADMAKLLMSVKDLTDEMEAQKRHCEQVRRIIASHSNEYFSHVLPSRGYSISDCLTQHLIYHRLLMSPVDAVYSVSFFQLLLEMDIPGYSHVQMCDSVIKHIVPLLFCTTEAEASFVGYAIHSAMRPLNRWFEHEQAFEEQARSRVGFTRQFGWTLDLPFVGGSEDVGGHNAEVQSEKTEKSIQYHEFKDIYKHWHSRVFACVVACLQPDKEYMYVRSALVFLSRLAEFFPSLSKEGAELLGRVEDLRQKETKRVGLQTMALSISILLRKQRWLDQDQVLDVPVAKPTTEADLKTVLADVEKRPGSRRPSPSPVDRREYAHKADDERTSRALDIKEDVLRRDGKVALALKPDAAPDVVKNSSKSAPAHNREKEIRERLLDKGKEKDKERPKDSGHIKPTDKGKTKTEDTDREVVRNDDATLTGEKRAHHINDPQSRKSTHSNGTLNDGVAEQDSKRASKVAPMDNKSDRKFKNESKNPAPPVKAIAASATTTTTTTTTAGHKHKQDDSANSFSFDRDKKKLRRSNQSDEALPSTAAKSAALDAKFQHQQQQQQQPSHHASAFNADPSNHQQQRRGPQQSEPLIVSKLPYPPINVTGPTAADNSFSGSRGTAGGAAYSHSNNFKSGGAHGSNQQGHPNSGPSQDFYLNAPHGPVGGRGGSRYNSSGRGGQQYDRQQQRYPRNN